MGRDDKANVPAGIALICLTWLMFSGLACSVCVVWKDQVKELFPSESSRLSPFMVDRTPVLVWTYLVSLVYFATLQRTSHICSYILLFDLTSQEFELIAANFMLAVFCFIFAFQAIRMRLHYQYYVVIANSDWTKLLDSSLESSVSFWVKYKSVLLSNKVSAAALGLFFVFWSSLIIGFDRQFRLVRTMIVIFVVFSSLAVFALLYGVPENRSGQRFELRAISGGIIVLAVLSGVASNVVRNLVTVAVINQSILISHTTLTMFVSFIYSPHCYFQSRLSHTSSIPECSPETLSVSTGVSSSRTRVYEVMSDVELLTKFMRFCCDNWCAENILALLEVRELKRAIRRELRKKESNRGTRTHTRNASSMTSNDLTESSVPKSGLEDESTSHKFVNRQYSLRNGSVSTKSTRSRAKSRGTLDMSQQLAEHSQLLRQVKEIDDFPQSAFFDESLCSWDLHCKVSLSQLGCQSSIVSNKDRTLSDKARLLCEKYFEYTSQYCVNVSESSRRVILSLVGEHSTVADSLDSLVFLFLFDEAVKDLIDNLNDSLIRFCPKPKQ